MTRAALAVAVLIAACSKPPGVVRSEVRAYYGRLQTWAPVEAETERAIERILRTQFVDEAEVRRQIADDRPRVLAHLERVRAYQPQSEEVKDVHARYIAAWVGLLGGYDAIEQGFGTGDYTKLARGREAMEAWRAEIADVARTLRDLMQRFDVEPGATVESRASGGCPHSATQSTKSSACPAVIA